MAGEVVGKLGGDTPPVHILYFLGQASREREGLGGTSKDRACGGDGGEGRGFRMNQHVVCGARLCVNWHFKNPSLLL